MSALVLIVDDEPGILTTLSQILVDEGYRTITTTSGEEAVHLFREQRDLPHGAAGRRLPRHLAA